MTLKTNQITQQTATLFQAPSVTAPMRMSKPDFTQVRGQMAHHKHPRKADDA